MAELAPESPADAHLFERLAGVQKESRPWLRAAGVVALLVLVVATTLLLTSKNSHLSAALGLAQSQAKAQGDELAAVRESYQETQEELDLMHSPGAAAVVLTAAADSALPGASGVAVWSADAGAVKVWLYGLGATPSGKRLAVWLDKAGTPMPAGVLEVTPNGAAFLLAKHLPSADGATRLFVTIEGVDQTPTKPSGAAVIEGALPTLEPGVAVGPAQQPKAPEAGPAELPKGPEARHGPVARRHGASRPSERN